MEKTSENMTRVERVLLLQGVPLFKFCTTEEIVRIAAIADIVEFEAEEDVYTASEPALALYCVVSGRVRLLTDDGEERRVAGSREAFGVLEILSGRLRQLSARAAEPTIALSVAADDFFDLLANNVEIVRAVFRELLDLTAATDVGRRLEGRLA